MMWVMTSLVVLLLLLGHWLQCSCPMWVLQQEGASLRYWSALWFSVSTSIKGRRVPLLFVGAGTVLHGEGLPNGPGQDMRLPDLTKAWLQPYGNFGDSQQVVVFLPWHTTQCSLFLYELCLAYLFPCVVILCFEVSGLIFHFLWCLTMLLSEISLTSFSLPSFRCQLLSSQWWAFII